MATWRKALARRLVVLDQLSSKCSDARTLALCFGHAARLPKSN
jgi:hypothetical protein